jgi:alpha-D-ribose 1-methylphosphonate 5-triphosphate diphosphatase PhnM
VVETDSGQALLETDEGNNFGLSTSPTDIPATLTLELAARQLAENAPNRIVRATLSRNGDLAQPLLVSITNDHPDRVTTPAGVTLPAGAASVGFDLTVLADGIVNGNQDVKVGAAANGYVGDSATLTVIDTD